MFYGKIKGIRHYVYDDIDEFKSENEGNVVNNWRDGQEGDWVLSDDDTVVQILKRGDISHHNDRKNYKYSSGWCRTIVGTFLITKKTYMDTDFSQHKNRYTFSKTIGNVKNIRKRKTSTHKEKLFTANVVSGMGAVKSYMDAFGEENYDNAKKRGVVLLRQERIMSEIEKGVLDVAKGMGIDHEYVLERLKRLADYSEDDNIILQSAKELGKIIGTSGVTVKQRDTGIIGMFDGFSPKALDDAQRKEISSGDDESNIEE